MTDEIIVIEESPEMETVVMAEIYSKNGNMGIKFTNEGDSQKINYFLESYLKVERERYEESFKDLTGDEL